MSSSESELYAAVKTASEGLGIQSAAKDLGISEQTESAPGCFGNDVLGQSQGTGQGEASRHAKPPIQVASKSGQFTTKNVDTSVNPADLMTKPMSTARIEPLQRASWAASSWTMNRAHRKVSQRRHKDSDVRRDSHITAGLGAKGTAEAFAKAQQIILMTGHVFRVREVLFYEREKSKYGEVVTGADVDEFE